MKFNKDSNFFLRFCQILDFEQVYRENAFLSVVEFFEAVLRIFSHLYLNIIPSELSF